MRCGGNEQDSRRLRAAGRTRHDSLVPDGVETVAEYLGTAAWGFSIDEKTEIRFRSAWHFGAGTIRGRYIGMAEHALSHASPASPVSPVSDVAPCTGFSPEDRPAYEDYGRCVHCGLCLNHCPTYRLWGREADSPRGRIRQIALVDEGRLAIGEEFVTHIDRCLDCRACETACPSGVEYGKLVELARAQIERNYKRPFIARLIRDVVYRRLLPYPKRIALAARMMRLYQSSGLRSLARATGILG